MRPRDWNRINWLNKKRKWKSELNLSQGRVEQANDSRAHGGSERESERVIGLWRGRNLKESLPTAKRPKAHPCAFLWKLRPRSFIKPPHCKQLEFGVQSNFLGQDESSLAGEAQHFSPSARAAGRPHFGGPDPTLRNQFLKDFSRNTFTPLKNTRTCKTKKAFK
ncbi:hypothetical protein LSTR_LSTR014746, partial [Laodelphax striatellus]